MWLLLIIDGDRCRYVIVDVVLGIKIHVTANTWMFLQCSWGREKSRENNQKIEVLSCFSGHMSKYWLATQSNVALEKKLHCKAVNSHPRSSSSRPAQFISSAQRLWGCGTALSPKRAICVEWIGRGDYRLSRVLLSHATTPGRPLLSFFLLEWGCLWVGRSMRL